MPMRGSKQAAIVGVGYTECVRYSGKSITAFTQEACLKAIEDAGLKPSDIDGITSFPSAPHPAARQEPGYDIIPARYLMQSLPVENIRWFTQLQNSMAVIMPIEAANAVISGACNYVLAYRSMFHPPGERYGEVRNLRAGGTAQFYSVYGHAANPQWEAMQYRRYLDKFGAKRESLATFVLNDHDNAQLNERAYWQGKPINKEDYLNSRWITEPMCLFDCDIPVDACQAIVITTAERARDLPNRPAYIAGYAVTPENMATVENPMTTPTLVSARRAFAMAGYSPRDIQFAEFYD